MPRIHDTLKIGERYGRLTIASAPFRKSAPTKSNPSRTAFAYTCKCDCGEARTVPMTKLRSGHAKSCGCIRKENAKVMGAVSRPKHGGAMGGKGYTPEYKAWVHLKERCLNPDHPSWPNYGGRGITVCDEWRNDFGRFLADMGPRPSSGHTIERVENDQGYSKDNCVWASRKEQADNTRKTVHHELDGERHNQSEWARIQGIPQPTISLRIKRGWSLEEALNRRPKYEKSPPIEFNGERHTLFEWSQITGIDYRALHSRFKRGWDVARMLNTPTGKYQRKN